jgi:hypothetical protein
MVSGPDIPCVLGYQELFEVLRLTSDSTCDTQVMFFVFKHRDKQ